MCRAGGVERGRASAGRRPSLFFSRGQRLVSAQSLFLRAPVLVCVCLSGFVSDHYVASLTRWGFRLWRDIGDGWLLFQSFRPVLTTYNRIRARFVLLFFALLLTFDNT
jgi:hypothetical protein